MHGIHRGPVNSPYKWPVTRKMFPFDDVIMQKQNALQLSRDGEVWNVIWKPFPSSLKTYTFEIIDSHCSSETSMFSFIISTGTLPTGDLPPIIARISTGTVMATSQFCICIRRVLDKNSQCTWDIDYIKCWAKHVIPRAHQTLITA